MDMYAIAFETAVSTVAKMNETARELAGARHAFLNHVHATVGRVGLVEHEQLSAPAGVDPSPTE